MKIVYHKPNTYERRKKANFWLSTGKVVTMSAAFYLLLLFGTTISAITLIIILFNK